MEMENVRDYILPEKIENQGETKKIKIPKAVEYETVFVSGPDFAIRRKTPKSSSVLVVILSKKQYYIKTENTGKIESLAAENFQKFLADIPEGDFHIIDNDGNEPYWIHHILKECKLRNSFLANIANEKFCVFAKANLICMDYVKEYNSYTPSHLHQLDFDKVKFLAGISDAYVPHEAVKEAVTEITCGPNRSTSKINLLFYYALNMNSSYGYRSEEESAYNIIHEKWGIEGVKQIVQMYYETPVSDFPRSSNLKKLFYRCKTELGWSQKTISYNGDEMLEQTRFDLQSFKEYLFCEATRQGYADEIENFIDSWSDYLNLQLAVYGEIRNKYPENLASEEKRLAYRQVQRLKNIADERLVSVLSECAEYEYKSSKYSILAPKSAGDVIAEGQNQSNCVGSYIPSIINRDCMIFFMRDNKALDKSLVTVEVRKDGSLGQVKAFANRAPQNSELDFVEGWYEKVFLPKYEEGKA